MPFHMHGDQPVYYLVHLNLKSVSADFTDDIHKLYL